LPETDAGVADEVLVRARQGERAAFAALVRSHQNLVYSIALRMLADPALAEDLSQEVFLQMHGSLRSIESPAHLIFWLRRVSTHRAIDRLRQRGLAEWAPLEEVIEVPAESLPDDPLLQGRLRSLVAQLPPMARAVVVLRFQEDLDPTEIAQALDMPLNTVKSHLKRSLANLRRQLSAEPHDSKAARHEG
jgi:RNA polymerase sigma-70 factor, ECF subfamily